jgi:uncharacterized protein (TIGR02466 family)
MKIESQFAELFTTPVWKLDVQGIDNKSIAEYVYGLESETSGAYISNRGGWHSSEITEPVPDAVNNLFTILQEFVQKNCSSLTGIKDLQVGNFWFNINRKGDYNISHDHQKSILSAVYYIQVQAENTGNLIIERNDNSTFFLGRYRNQSPFASQSLSVDPQESLCYIFPAWTKHSVERNESETDRISVALNFVDPN